MAKVCPYPARSCAIIGSHYMQEYASYSVMNLPFVWGIRYRSNDREVPRQPTMRTEAACFS
jgi:hypothetical protein